MEEEIGMIARQLDETKTVYERMKLEKDQLKRIAISLILYVVVLLLFKLLL
jgi:hypothetical protein